MKCGECEYIRPPCGSGWPYDGERCGRTGVVVRSSDAQCELMILRASVAELEAERDRLKAESAKLERAARSMARVLRVHNVAPNPETGATRTESEWIDWSFTAALAPQAQEEEG